jgi:hypothetical protein
MSKNKPIIKYSVSKALTEQQSEYIIFKSKTGLPVSLKDFTYFHELYLKEKQLEKNLKNERS